MQQEKLKRKCHQFQFFKQLSKCFIISCSCHKDYFNPFFLLFKTISKSWMDENPQKLLRMKHEKLSISDIQFRLIILHHWAWLCKYQVSSTCYITKAINIIYEIMPWQILVYINGNNFKEIWLMVIVLQ